MDYYNHMPTDAEISEEDDNSEQMAMGPFMGPMGENPMIGQNPMMGQMDPRMMGQNPMMGQMDPRMMGQNQMMGQNPMMGQMDSRMQQMDPRMRQAMMQQAMMAQMGQGQMGQNPMMQQGPMMGQMDPRMIQQGPMMAQPPMMQQQPMSRPVSLPEQDEQAAMRHKLREFFSGGKGPVSIPLPSVQHVMQLEANLHQIKAELVKSFYQDLVQYKLLTRQLKLRMRQKMSLLRQIEARLASPLRAALMDGRINVPVAAPMRPRRVVTTHVAPEMEDQGLF